MAVALFVVTGLAGKRFDYMDKECFETEYGVPIFVAMCLPYESETASDFGYAVAVAALLGMVAAGVWLIVRAAIVRGGYNALLEEGDYSRENKVNQMRNVPLASIYWGVVTAGFLGYSFITGRWDRSWIVWPVAGVLYGVIMAIVGAVRKKG